MGKRKLVPGEKQTFFTIKCKLKSIASPKVCAELERTTVIAHDIFKRASLFLRAYCLGENPFPSITVSTIRHCINCVCTRDKRGPKPKDDSLGASMRLFWNQNFSRAYPDVLDGKGIRVLKQHLD